MFRRRNNDNGRDRERDRDDYYDDRVGTRPLAATTDGPLGECVCGQAAVVYIAHATHGVRVVCGDCSDDAVTHAGWREYPSEVVTRPGPDTAIEQTGAGNGWHAFELRETHAEDGVTDADADEPSDDAWFRVRNTSDFDTPNMLVRADRWR